MISVRLGTAVRDGDQGLLKGSSVSQSDIQNYVLFQKHFHLNSTEPKNNPLHCYNKKIAFVPISNSLQPLADKSYTTASDGNCLIDLCVAV